MDESVWPLCLKRATITLLLMRPGLDKEDMKNYRPISKLPFISKLFEYVVTRRMEEHNALNGSYQSAYRRNHSTQIVLLNIQNDIARAFNVIHHPILLCLEFSRSV